MNNFEPKEISKASKYLEEKLKIFKQESSKSEDKNVYIVEDKKDSLMKRFVGSIFKS